MWILRLLVVGGLAGGLAQSAAFVLAAREGSVAGLAALGAALSALTLVGLVLWLAAGARRAASEPAPRTAEPTTQTAVKSEPPSPEATAVPSADTQPRTVEAVPPAPLAASKSEAPSPASGVVIATPLAEMAHDINNLMTVVVTHAELLRERHAGQNAAELDPIFDAAARLSGVARKLLVFAERQRAEAPEPERSLLAGPGLVRATRDPQPPRDSIPSILDAVEAVRDSESAVRESHSIIAARRPPEGSRGVILLVEDELVLLRATRRMLEQRGYRVRTATSGPEALDRAFESADIDVLVTDLSLPGMDGKELARRLRWLVPELAVLYMSGYDAVTSGLTLAPGGREAFLPKPFTPRDLAERLTELCGPSGREPLAQPG